MKNYRFACLLLFLILPNTHLYAQLWRQYMDSAKAYQEQQKLDQAIAFSQQAYEAIQKDSAGTKTYASVCNSLGAFYYMAGENAKAKPLFLEAKQLREKLLGKGHLDYAASCNNLANLYADEGQYEQAEMMYLETKQIREQQFGRQHPEYARSCTNLALLYFNMGRFEKAEPLFIEAKMISEKVSGKDQAYYARACNNLAMLYQHIGIYEKAETLYLEAMHIQEKLLGKQHNDYLRSCNNLGALYAQQHQYEKAEPLYQEVKQVREKLLGMRHPEYASCCNNLAMLYAKMKQYEKAELLYLEAKQIREEVLGKNNPDYARNCGNLAKLYLYMGRTKEAVSLLVEAKQIQASMLGKQNVEYGLSCEDLANAYSQAQQPLQAEKEYEEAFAIRLHNLDTVFQFTSDKEKEAYVKNILGGDDKALSFYLAAKPRSALPYSLSLFHRNLVLSSAASLKKTLFAANDPELAQKYTQWVSTKKQLADLVAQPVEERGEGGAALEERAGLLEKELTRRSGAFAKQQERPDWKQIQSRLKEGEAAVEYVSFQLDDGRQFTDTVLYAAIVLKKNAPSPVMIRLCSEQQLTGLVSAAGNQSSVAGIQKLVSISEAGEHMPPSLYELIWKPLEQELRGITTVYFAPAGLLHTIPFAAVAINTQTVLSDKYRLIQLATTASIGEPRQSGITAAGKIQLYGGISYSADTSQLKDIAFSYRNNSIATRSLPEDLVRSGTWSELPATKKEMESILASSGPYQPNITLHAGLQATEESLKTLGGNASPAILHIATHGFFFPDPAPADSSQTGRVFKSSDDPLMRAGLLFAGANHAWQNKPVKDIDDGILTAYEIANLYLPHTKLVVLSACETGLGEIRGSEGVYGLQRAFKIAGAQNLVMSLWKVPDGDTAEFMETFYKNLFNGQSISDAFYQAQKTMKAKYRSKPFRWAAWILLQ